MMDIDHLESLSDDELVALLNQRETDAKKLDVMQLGYKVTLNSAYGMIGSEYSRYFDTRIAEAITLSGQLSIRWIERKLDEYLNVVCGTEGESFAVAGDTDSIYISLSPLVDKFFPGAEKAKIVGAIDKLCEQKIQPVIDKAYNELADYMNAYQQKMFMAREVIADRGIWRAKKNYVLNVWNSEGVAYDEPKLKILGIESVRSSTPAICRDSIKETLRILMTEDETAVQEFIKKFKGEFMAASVFDISRNSGVSDIVKWDQPEGFMLRTPYHVKASMVYNRLIEEHDLGGKYRKIRNGDKVKLIQIKPANPTFNSMIAFHDELPPEFDMDRFVDKKTHYQKTFLDPVESLLDIVGWHSTKTNTLW